MTIRCAGCGRFVSYDDIQSGRASSKFVPDSAYSTEEVAFHCVACTAECGAPVILQTWGAF
jgi:hypothetical protein